MRCCARKSSTAITRSVGGEVLPAPLSRSSITVKPPVPVRRSPTFLTYPVATLYCLDRFYHCGTNLYQSGAICTAKPSPLPSSRRRS
ncbi:Uncharacterised protein [Mycobacteroides abscessus subsp. abscessus]|nr:Uncharacterised protein [Mycobacteroides abscessus subsp. abscessus]